MASMKPVDLAAQLRHFPGHWVALKAGRAVMARPTTGELVRTLQAAGIRDATIVRSPAPDDPLLVGLG